MTIRTYDDELGRFVEYEALDFTGRSAPVSLLNDADEERFRMQRVAPGKNTGYSRNDLLGGGEMKGKGIPGASWRDEARRMKQSGVKCTERRPAA